MIPKPYLIFILLTISLCSYAEDIIVMRNVEIERAYVLEVRQDEIKYRKISNLDGPIYTISKREVLSIVYDNGETDKFDAVQAFERMDNQVPTEVSPIPNYYNDSLIAEYNNEYPTMLGKELQDKYVGDAYVYWGITENSILSTDEIEIEIDRVGGYDKYLYESISNDAENDFNLKIRNKTNHILYVDLANSFISISYNGNESSKAWYDSSIYSSAQTNSSDVAFSISNGSTNTSYNGKNKSMMIKNGNASTTNVSNQMEKIISIPPQSVMVLPGHQTIIYDKVATRFEDLCINKSSHPKNTDNLIRVKKFELVNFMPSNSPFKRSYYLTLSTSIDFTRPVIVPIHLYARSLYGGLSFLGNFNTKKYNVTNPKKLIVSSVSLHK